MIHDLDRTMRKSGVNGIVVFGDTTLQNPDLTYVVGGALPRGGTYFKRMGKEPLLLVSNLDMGTAKKLGRVRRVQTYTQWGMESLAKKYGPRGDVLARVIANVLKREGVGGRVGLFGRNDLGFGIRLTDKLRKLGVKVVGAQPPTILESARETKDRFEIDEIRDVGRRTAEAVNEVVNVLRNAKKKRGHYQIGKSRATIGVVKSVIGRKLVEKGLIAPEGTIFAIGPSGADPHNMGVDGDEIKAGRLIVFDIFPQAESGYWFDLTRTFVLGRGDAKARRAFEAVSEAQTASLDTLGAGVKCEVPMVAACDTIERAGYRTIREVYAGKSKALFSGFNHSLGHGVGLTIGERPYLSLLRQDILKQGSVVTVEPGIYMPNYGGVRIEDTVRITRNGFEHLANVEKELEIT